jgi:hypothetical protein
MSSSALLRSVLKRNAFSLPASFKLIETVGSLDLDFLSRICGFAMLRLISLSLISFHKEPFVPMTLGDGSTLPQSVLLEQLAALSTDTIDDADNKPRRPLSHQYCPDPYSHTRPRPSSYPSLSKLARPAPEPDFTSIFFWSVHTGMYELPVADVTEADVELSISIGLAARERMGVGSEVLKPVLVEEEEEGVQARVKEDGKRTSILKPLTFAPRATAKVLDELAEGCRDAEGNKERGEELATEAKAADVPLPSRSSQRHIPPPLALTVTSGSLSSSTHLTVSTSPPSFSIGKPELSPCSLLDTYFTLSPFDTSALSSPSDPPSPVSPSGCSFIVDLYFDPLSPTPSPTLLASSGELSCLPPSPAPTASSFDLDAYFSPLPSPAASGYSFTVDLYMRDDDVESGEGSEDGESEGLVTPPSSPSKGMDVVLPGGDVEVVVPTTECAKEVSIGELPPSLLRPPTKSCLLTDGIFIFSTSP